MPSGLFPQLRIEMKIWDLGICCRQKSLFAKGQVSRERRVRGKPLQRESQERGCLWTGEGEINQKVEEVCWDLKHSLTLPCWAGKLQ